MPLQLSNHFDVEKSRSNFRIYKRLHRIGSEHVIVRNPLLLNFKHIRLKGAQDCIRWHVTFAIRNAFQHQLVCYYVAIYVSSIITL